MMDRDRALKVTKKWRLIKLSKMQRSDFAAKFIENCLNTVEGIDILLHSFAVKYGREKGAEVKKSIPMKSIDDVAEFLGMISGIAVKKFEGYVEYTGCPSYSMTEVRRTEVCRGFLEGFFKAFNLSVDVELNCGEICTVVVRLKD
ncbi:hypothetical protein [Archaeoglobus neptunius]|uniref:hypothetical protein n=1 Tax=Archaeoglobus neptunius TaxID=2798580 RepID=UPI00192728D1|nr:hypothetical protein [Archaeoglobus neptunius]